MTKRWQALTGPDNQVIITRSFLGDWGSDENYVGLVVRRDYRLLRAAPALYDELTQALAWIENMVARFGQDAVLDCMPNNWAGRLAIRDALALAEDEPTIQPGRIG